MGLSHTEALLVCAIVALLIFIPWFIILYPRDPVPKLTHEDLAWNEETNRLVNDALMRDLAEIEIQRQLEEQKIIRAERIAQEILKYEQERIQKEEKQKYLNFVFSDPMYKQGKRTVKTTDYKVLPLWDKTVERLDNNASIHSVIIDVYGISTGGKTYTVYHNTIKKLYARHKEYKSINQVK